MSEGNLFQNGTSLSHMTQEKVLNKVTNEDLARMIKQGFDGVDKRFEEVPTKVEIYREFREVKQRLSALEQDRMVVQKIKNALALE